MATCAKISRKRPGAPKSYRCNIYKGAVMGKWQVAGMYQDIKKEASSYQGLQMQHLQRSCTGKVTGRRHVPRHQERGLELPRATDATMTKEQQWESDRLSAGPKISRKRPEALKGYRCNIHKGAVMGK